MALRRFILIPVIIAVSVAFWASYSRANKARTAELHSRVYEIFNLRARAIITGNAPGAVLSHYDTTATLGEWGLSHEKAKLNYIQLWAKKRGVRIIEANPSLRIPWCDVRENTAELVVHQTLQLGYVYSGDRTIHRFGVGTRHWMVLVRKKGKWLIQQDFYTDALGDDSLVPNPEPANGAALIKMVKKTSKQSDQSSGYDREGAVRYADKYAGLAWGAGNNHNYNSRYGNMEPRGGDCANYVSQCLNDKEGGKLPLDGSWYYCIDQDGFSGSQAWLRAPDFCDWLLYGGRGQRIAWGTFPELNRPSKKFPSGAVRELQKGDVIGYESDGYIEHVAIVVGTDSKGYPLVNSHSVDRYHCPWDMGYDKATVYHLFRINDM